MKISNLFIILNTLKFVLFFRVLDNEKVDLKTNFWFILKKEKLMDITINGCMEWKLNGNGRDRP